MGKPSNVMLDKLQHAKVCDFGLSKPYTWGKELLGDLAYLFEGDAPDSAHSTDEAVKMVYDAPSDVYSFGILLWELAHRKVPFAGIDGVQVATKVAPSGQRPPLQLPEGLQDLESIIASCWHRDPTQRPSMSVCAERLCALDR